MAAWNERLGKAQKQIIDVVTLLGAHFEGVAESFRGKEAKPRATALDDGIRDQRRAMHDLRNIRDLEISLPSQLAQTLKRASGRIMRRGETFVERNTPIVSVKKNEIRERSADIKPDTIFRHGHT